MHIEITVLRVQVQKLLSKSELKKNISVTLTS